MELEHISKLLERYNEGKCTSEESRLIEQWFEGINQQYTTQINENELQAELAGIGLELNKKIEGSQKRTLRTLRPWYYVAAAIAMLVTAGASYLLVHNKAADNQHLITQKISDGYMIITVAKGDTTHITLEDGSTVILNAASRLRYPAHFTGGHRDLYLEEGEAFFNVAPQPNSTFTVHAGNTSTTALGTSFNIRAYTYEQKITVALLTGKVKVTTEIQQQEPIVLSTSEQASINLQSQEITRSTFDEQDPSGWQKGTLNFKDASYEEVRSGIENMYGVTVINQSNKKTWTYTGNFKKETLKNVMETICLIESLSFTIKRDTVLLKNRRTNAR